MLLQRTEQYSIVHMYHFFIHLSVGGHLVCFHALAIVNSAIMIGSFSRHSLLLAVGALPCLSPEL